MPLVLALVPHRYLHSFMAPDLLVSVLGRTPSQLHLLPDCPKPGCPTEWTCPLLPTGDCECEWAAGHPQLVAL